MIHSSSAARVGSSSGTVRSVPSLPRDTFKQLPWLAESQTQSISRSSSSARDAGAVQHSQPSAGERVSQLPDGSQQVPVGVGRAGLGATACPAGEHRRGTAAAPTATQPSSQGQVIKEAAQVDDGPLADHRRHGLVAGDPAAQGPLVVESRQVIKTGLKKIQYQAALIEGCLAGTGLTLEPDRTDIAN